MKQALRVFLVHWKPEEAPERVERLEAAGLSPFYEPITERGGLGFIRQIMPDAVVISLERLPGNGRDVGIYVRQTKATRHIPIVFIGGDPDKVAKYRTQLPDAVYADWEHVGRAVREAVAHPVVDPVVPGSILAGYSGTPLPKKLGIQAGHAVILECAPSDFERTLGQLPGGVTIRRTLTGTADVVLLFVTSRKTLCTRLEKAMAAMADGAGLWIIWPKKTSGLPCDINQNDVRRIGLETGLVDHKVAAIDETWSGLRFVKRK